MPSPFPGMDPYLETPSLWGGIHGGLIAVLGELLTRQVAPRYFVNSDRHIYTLPADDPGRPLLSLSPEPVDARYAYLAVEEPRGGPVVTTIEVVSPIEKVPGSVGWFELLRRRQQAMRSTVHWIEIDLLRAGTRPPEVELQRDYYMLLHRAGRQGGVEVWYTDLRQELPTIAVPLVAPLPDVPLDLQAAVEMVYDRYRYDAALDYRQPPPAPPLRPEDAAWTAERIRRWQAERAAEHGSGDAGDE